MSFRTAPYHSTTEGSYRKVRYADLSLTCVWQLVRSTNSGGGGMLITF